MNMNKYSGFKVAALAAAIALAMSSTAVMAAAPTAAQLPGAGKVVMGSATGSTIAAGAQTITFTGNTVINWGAAGSTINATSQPAGFNVGSSAKLGFTDSASAGSAVLNVDVSGNPSQIFGTLTMNTGGGNLYVANANGIIVGAKAKISGPGTVGLIANTLGTLAFDGSASTTSMEYEGGGGDVTVLTGAAINGSNVIVSGGGMVNVDLSTLKSGTARLRAGVKNSNSSLVNDNTGAVLTTTGDMGGAALTAFQSAGDASTDSTTITLGAGAGITRVDGTLTNTGTLTLASGFAIEGGLVNNKSVIQTADVSMGSLVNNLAYDGGGFNLTTSAGGIDNSGQMIGIAATSITGGDFVNNGQFTATGDLRTYGGGNITNNGVVQGVNLAFTMEGGDFNNAGTMTSSANVGATNGSVTNSGKLAVNNTVAAISDSAADGFTAGADYSITNTGTIKSGSSNLLLQANTEGDRSGPANDSTGSVSNSGILQVGAGFDLEVKAYNDVNLAGSVQSNASGTYKALSATNMLNGLTVHAAGYDGTDLNSDGVATVATNIVSGGDVNIYGNQVQLMSNLSAAGNTVAIGAGDKSDTGYAVRIAAGKTVLADTVEIDGVDGVNPNVILQGTISGNEIRFGYNDGAISDLFSGPTGNIVASGSSPHVHVYFTGAIKTAPYLNTPSNFRYNYLPISAPDDKLYLELNPVAYMTSGTSTGSAVNILVNGDVNVDSVPNATVHAPGSSVTGVTNIPNTHLVLQSTGNIETGDSGDFYWPGYVYLGNVSKDADGNALPGTLGLGTITTTGEFNNVLPGDVSGASGIHFITQFPMTIGGDVVTNANAWVNFGSELLTQAYAGGTLTGNFFGGVAGAGKVVNYGPLDASNFNTQVPSAAQ